MRPSPRQQQLSAVKNTWEDSGFKWGAFDLIGERPWRLQIEQQGGSVRYPYDTRDTKHSQHVRACQGQQVIVKGNWAEDHSHPRQYQDLDSYYWDNCLLPQLMTTPRPRSSRDWWTRLVKGGPFPGRYLGTERELQAREHRVNQLLQALGQARRWRDLIKVNPFGYDDNTVIWLRPQSQVLEWYYGISTDRVERWLIKECASRGLRLVTRPKPARHMRVGEHGVYAECRRLRPRYVVGVHTAAAAEVLCAGTEFIAIGQTAFMGMTSSFDHSACPTPDEVIERCRELLLVSRNKGLELLNGDWSLDHYEQLFERQTEWRITSV